ncbi:MAG: hypothetical protein IT303_14990 [Dehalococcoidia bacterium]|nr:hypothetical protein [Dehalococcoidia bacterium]
MKTAQANLRIYGIEPDCDCDSIVGRAVRQIDGVRKVEFDQGHHTMWVDFVTSLVTVDQVVDTIERYGFRVARESSVPALN